MILQKRVAIGPDDTAASLYFDKIFPLGVEALVQATDLVVGGRATEWSQIESEATYEGCVRVSEGHINWATLVDHVYDLIRGCNPAPGAWTSCTASSASTCSTRRKSWRRPFGAVRGKKLGQVVSNDDGNLRIHAQGGFIDVSRVRLDGAKDQGRRRRHRGRYYPRRLIPEG